MIRKMELSKEMKEDDLVQDTGLREQLDDEEFERYQKQKESELVIEDNTIYEIDLDSYEALTKQKKRLLNE